MTSAQVVETSVTNNSSFQNYTRPDDHTIRTTDTPGFKPFSLEQYFSPPNRTPRYCPDQPMRQRVKTTSYGTRRP